MKNATIFQNVRTIQLLNLSLSFTQFMSKHCANVYEVISHQTINWFSNQAVVKRHTYLNCKNT